MGTGNPMLIDGAFRAVAMLRLRPDAEAIGQIVSYVSALPAEHHLRFWVAAAAPGWGIPARSLPSGLRRRAAGGRANRRYGSTAEAVPDLAASVALAPRQLTSAYRSSPTTVNLYTLSALKRLISVSWQRPSAVMFSNTSS